MHSGDSKLKIITKCNGSGEMFFDILKCGTRRKLIFVFGKMQFYFQYTIINLSSSYSF